MTEPLFDVVPITLHLAQPFRVAHGVSETRTAHWLRLRGDAGWGEGTIPPYYTVDPASMQRCWDALRCAARPLPESPSAIAAWIGEDGPAPARAAVDLALHDRLGRACGKPLHALLGWPEPEPRPSAVTLGLDGPEAVAARAAALGPHRVLKLKLGRGDDLARVRAVREARPDAVLYGDANGAWSAEDAVRALEPLAELGLELIEQPTPDATGLGFVQARTAIPVVADESLQSAADLERLAELGVRGVNVKLMKLGGIAASAAVIRRARALGMKTLLGCMIETSIGVTAAAHLSALVDWIDLDAPLLVVDDPFEGLAFDVEGRILMPNRPGIGARRRPERS